MITQIVMATRINCRFQNDKLVFEVKGKKTTNYLNWHRVNNDFDDAEVKVDEDIDASYEDDDNDVGNLEQTRTAITSLRFD